MYHNPVLLAESIDALIVDKEGSYVDATFGGGGHSREILKRLGKSAKLMAFDLDSEANENKIDDSRLLLINQNYRYLKRYLKLNNWTQVNGLLADLGVSSHQLDVNERGFSFRGNAPLDMRMNQVRGVTAAEWLHRAGESEIQSALSEYGNVRNAKTLAAALVDARRKKRLNTTQDLVGVLAAQARGNKMRYYAQVFQAIRIVVNEEMEALKEMLTAAAECLMPGGVLAVITYHSLEDRLVKNAIRNGNKERGTLLKLDKRKFILPTEDEIKLNPRARSAKLRIAYKVG